MKKLNFLLLIFLCFIMPLNGFGETWVEQPGEKAYDLRDKVLKPGKAALKPKAINFLSNYLENLNAPNTKLELVHRRKSPMGHHLSFVQTYLGTPVYGSEVKLNLSKEYEILSLYHKTLPTKTWNIAPFDHASFDSLLSANKISLVPETKRQEVIYYENGKAQSALKIRQKDQAGFPVEVVYSQNLQKLYQKELTRRAAPDTTLNGYVFLPDPLTSAGVSYGSPYVNANDSDVKQLNAERKLVPIPVNQTNPDTFFLEGPYAKIVDESVPNNQSAFTVNGMFDYKRAAPQFEEVNVYYHLHNFRSYIGEELGLENLAAYQIPADAHGQSGDNSYYLLTGDSTGKLSFGDGGVDDGEDADIVIHEYSHALSHNASPNFPAANNSESEALEEGLADYLACSYSRQMNEYGWESLFNWDGHNEFWTGRSCTTDKKYPEDLTNNIYSDGTLWAGTMMEIRESVGKTVADRLMLTALYNFTSTMSMADAAHQIILAEEALYSKNYRSQIVHVLDNAGFIDREEYTGIKEEYAQSRSNAIKAYNTGNSFKVLLESPSEDLQVRLQTVNGKVLGKWHRKNAASLVINHNHLARGVYLISVHTNDASRTVRLIK